MNTIFCNLQPFDMTQYIYIIDEQGKPMHNFNCSFDDMIEIIPTLCQNNNIDTVYLFGITDYAMGLKDKILNYCKTNYNYKDLNLTINCGE